MNGTSYELPAIGKMSFENVVPHPSTGDRTIVVGLDDSGGGQVYVLGRGWYLADVQAHYSLAGELVQGGQLLAIHLPSGRN